MLINFCDSTFAIGESHSDKSLRYLKQIKQRNVEPRYDTNNVCVCRIDKPDCFLGFEFVDYDYEYKYLRKPDEDDRRERNELVLMLRKQGRSYREIAETIGNISHTTVRGIVNRAETM